MRLLLICFLISLSQSSAVFAIEDIVVKGLFKNTAIVTIDGKRRVLKTGKTSPEGAKLIMANSEKAIIEIEGERETYKLGRHISTSFKPAPDKASISIAPTKSGMYKVNGSINDFSVKFLVDTGATLIAMSENHAKRLGIEYKLTGVVGSTSTASGKAKAWYIRLKKVKVGPLLMRDVDAAVIKGDHPTSILLGNSFLNQVQMVRNGKIMELRTK